jgi:hypothetical protein
VHLGRRLSVGPGSVATDQLDARMRPEPGRERGGLPIGQEIDHTMALQVHEHGAVALAPAPGPVIDAQHARGQDLRGGRAAEAGEERGRPDREPMAASAASARQVRRP